MSLTWRRLAAAIRPRMAVSAGPLTTSVIQSGSPEVAGLFGNVQLLTPLGDAAAVAVAECVALPVDDLPPPAMDAGGRPLVVPVAVAAAGGPGGAPPPPPPPPPPAGGFGGSAAPRTSVELADAFVILRVAAGCASHGAVAVPAEAVKSALDAVVRLYKPPPRDVIAVARTGKQSSGAADVATPAAVTTDVDSGRTVLTPFEVLLLSSYACATVSRGAGRGAAGGAGGRGRGGGAPAASRFATRGGRAPATPRSPAGTDAAPTTLVPADVVARAREMNEALIQQVAFDELLSLIAGVRIARRHGGPDADGRVALLAPLPDEASDRALLSTLNRRNLSPLKMLTVVYAVAVGRPSLYAHFQQDVADRWSGGGGSLTRKHVAPALAFAIALHLRATDPLATSLAPLFATACRRILDGSKMLIWDPAHETHPEVLTLFALLAHWGEGSPHRASVIAKVSQQLSEAAFVPSAKDQWRSMPKAYMTIVCGLPSLRPDTAPRVSGIRFLRIGSIGDEATETKTALHQLLSVEDEIAAECLIAGNPATYRRRFVARLLRRRVKRTLSASHASACRLVAERVFLMPALRRAFIRDAALPGILLRKTADIAVAKAFKNLSTPSRVIALALLCPAAIAAGADDRVPIVSTVAALVRAHRFDAASQGVPRPEHVEFALVALEIAMKIQQQQQSVLPSVDDPNIAAKAAATAALMDDATALFEGTVRALVSAAHGGSPAHVMTLKAVLGAPLVASEDVAPNARQRLLSLLLTRQQPQQPGPVAERTDDAEVVLAVPAEPPQAGPPPLVLAAWSPRAILELVPAVATAAGAGAEVTHALGELCVAGQRPALIEVGAESGPRVAMNLAADLFASFTSGGEWPSRVLEPLLRIVHDRFQPVSGAHLYCAIFQAASAHENEFKRHAVSPLVTKALTALAHRRAIEEHVESQGYLDLLIAAVPLASAEHHELVDSLGSAFVHVLDPARLSDLFQNTKGRVHLEKVVQAVFLERITALQSGHCSLQDMLHFCSGVMVPTFVFWPEYPEFLERIITAIGPSAAALDATRCDVIQLASALRKCEMDMRPLDPVIALAAVDLAKMKVAVLPVRRLCTLAQHMTFVSAIPTPLLEGLLREIFARYAKAPPPGTAFVMVSTFNAFCKMRLNSQAQSEFKLRLSAQARATSSALLRRDKQVTAEPRNVFGMDPVRDRARLRDFETLAVAVANFTVAELLTGELARDADRLDNVICVAAIVAALPTGWQRVHHFDGMLSAISFALQQFQAEGQYELVPQAAQQQQQHAGSSKSRSGASSVRTSMPANIERSLARLTHELSRHHAERLVAIERDPSVERDTVQGRCHRIRVSLLQATGADTTAGYS